LWNYSKYSYKESLPDVGFEEDRFLEPVFPIPIPHFYHYREEILEIEMKST
jgi:hypothetical protein